jgi:DNA-binding transcriptional ArsR family regulator
MRVEIKHKAAFEAAAKLKQIMKAKGGSWIVNSVGEEGFVACKMGTLDGKRMERSGADCLAGVYCESIEMEVLASELLAARKMNKALYGEDEEKPKGGEQIMVFTPTSEMVMQQLVEGPMRIDEISKRLGKAVSTVRMALYELRDKGVVEAQTIPETRAFAFGLAA